MADTPTRNLPASQLSLRQAIDHLDAPPAPAQPRRGSAARRSTANQGKPGRIARPRILLIVAAAVVAVLVAALLLT